MAAELPPVPTILVTHPFNLNSHVWIRLTDEGRAYLRRRHQVFIEGILHSWGSLAPDHVTRVHHLFPYTPPVETDGWSRWQLWDLFSRFGDQLNMGQPFNMFDLTIRMEEDPCSVSQS